MEVRQVLRTQYIEEVVNMDGGMDVDTQPGGRTYHMGVLTLLIGRGSSCVRAGQLTGLDAQQGTEAYGESLCKYRENESRCVGGQGREDQRTDGRTAGRPETASITDCIALFGFGLGACLGDSSGVRFAATAPHAWSND